MKEEEKKALEALQKSLEMAASQGVIRRPTCLIILMPKDVNPVTCAAATFA